MSVFDELEEATEEVDDACAESATLIDGEQARYPVSVVVGAFLVGWIWDEGAGNKRQVRQAHVVAFKSTNPDLVAALAGKNRAAIPKGWQLEWNGNTYRVDSPSSDELAFEFDLQQGVS